MPSSWFKENWLLSTFGYSCQNIIKLIYKKKTLNTPMQLYNDGSACISEINRTSTALTRVGGNCPICSESSLVRSSREASDSAASSFFTSAFVRCVTSDRDIFFSITFLKIDSWTMQKFTCKFWLRSRFFVSLFQYFENENHHVSKVNKLKWAYCARAFCAVSEGAVTEIAGSDPLRIPFNASDR